MNPDVSSLLPSVIGIVAPLLAGVGLLVEGLRKRRPMLVYASIPAAVLALTGVVDAVLPWLRVDWTAEQILAMHTAQWLVMIAAFAAAIALLVLDWRRLGRGR